MPEAVKLSSLRHCPLPNYGVKTSADTAKALFRAGSTGAVDKSIDGPKESYLGICRSCPIERGEGRPFLLGMDNRWIWAEVELWEETNFGGMALRIVAFKDGSEVR
jgi:hypothetical protein